MEVGHEIFSTVILSLPIQAGQLSVSGKRMCTILVTRLEDSLLSKVWLGRLTALNMTPLELLGRKTSIQTKQSVCADCFVCVEGLRLSHSTVPQADLDLSWSYMAELLFS